MLRLLKKQDVYNPVKHQYPGEKLLKRMGFFSDQEGIMSRYLYEQENWRPHLEQSKKVIIKFLEEKKPEHIAILGSGWLLDVPIDYLSKNIKNVYLVDIRHPRQIIHKYKDYTNVHFVLSDITGGAIENTYHALNSKGKNIKLLSSIKPEGFKFNRQFDAIISVNVLCQLDILVLEYIRTFKGIDDNEVIALRKKIQESHMNTLKELPSCLISDYEEHIYNRTGAKVSKNSLLFTKLPKSTYEEEWEWIFDTKMTYYPNRRTNFKVKALFID